MQIPPLYNMHGTSNRFESAAPVSRSTAAGPETKIPTKYESPKAETFKQQSYPAFLEQVIQLLCPGRDAVSSAETLIAFERNLAARNITPAALGDCLCDKKAQLLCNVRDEVWETLNGKLSSYGRLFSKLNLGTPLPPDALIFCVYQPGHEKNKQPTISQYLVLTADGDYWKARAVTDRNRGGPAVPARLLLPLPQPAAFFGWLQTRPEPLLGVQDAQGTWVVVPIPRIILQSRKEDTIGLIRVKMATDWAPPQKTPDKGIEAFTENFVVSLIKAKIPSWEGKVPSRDDLTACIAAWKSPVWSKVTPTECALRPPEHSGSEDEAERPSLRTIAAPSVPLPAPRQYDQIGEHNEHYHAGETRGCSGNSAGEFIFPSRRSCRWWAEHGIFCDSHKSKANNDDGRIPHLRANCGALQQD